MKDIKTKQKVLSLKTKDEKKNMKHFMLQQTIHKKDTTVKPQTENDVQTAPAQATNQITSTAKATLLQTIHKSKKLDSTIKRQIKKNKDIISTQPFETETIPVQPILSNRKKASNTSFSNVVPASAELQPIHYSSLARQHVKKKMQMETLKDTVTLSPLQQTSQFTKTIINKSFKVVKTSVSALNTLISFGTGLILLIVITLFIGTFSVLAQDGGSNSQIVSLSDEVIAYEETIRKYAQDYCIDDYVSLLQAIMMQESGGKGNDPMQSSESGYNTEYPQVPNGITNSEYSIQVGVHTFADCLQMAQVQNTSDMEHIYLALQGYNFGTGYITWAINNFNGYSKYNAQLFSDNKKAELHTNVYGDPFYVDHVMRYVSITFRGGTNPNFNNLEAWVTKNPYAQASLYGQCTWFAWGRFYELYGYDPGFRGNGWDCVDQLLATHADKFERSTTPKSGSVFSGIGRNHVGIVINWDGTTLTIQDGNYDGITNTFEDAKEDWKTVTYSLDEFRQRMKGVVFANPK